jgi:hypothetical protein
MTIDLRESNECLKSRNCKFWYKFHKRKREVNSKRTKLCLKCRIAFCKIKLCTDIEHNTLILNRSEYVKISVNFSQFQNKKKLI